MMTAGTNTALMRSAKPLQWRFVPLGIFDQALQPGQHRFGSHRTSP